MGMAGAALAVLVFLLYRNVERRIQARVISARLFSLLLIVAPLMLALVGLAAGGASLFAAAQLWSRKSLAHGDLGQSGELKGWIAAKSFLEACQEAKASRVPSHIPQNETKQSLHRIRIRRSVMTAESTCRSLLRHLPLKV
jgi:hypothetical protein